MFACEVLVIGIKNARVNIINSGNIFRTIPVYVS